MFAGIYYGAMYGGSTTAILMNTPGESGSMITTLDGHKMARTGRASAAPPPAAIGSFARPAGADRVVRRRHHQHDRSDIRRAGHGRARPQIRTCRVLRADRPGPDD